jgi:hypothetical protein
LGRFIQPDPTIPDPIDSQSFNRFSYCRNNPLNEVDPSGFDDGDDGDAGNPDGNVSDTGLPGYGYNPYGNFPNPTTPNQSFWGQIWQGLQQFGDNISEDLGNTRSNIH